MNSAPFPVICGRAAPYDFGILFAFLYRLFTDSLYR